MSKELAFTDDNDVVKYLDTTTAFNLALTADGVAFDLTNAKSVLVKIANDDGYIMQQTIDLTTVTSPLGGTISFPINQNIMNTLVPDDYDIEVWVTMKDGTQAIFPSDGTLGFSIEENLMSDTGEVIPVITFDQFEDQFNDMMTQMQNTVSNVKKGDKGDTGTGLEIKDKVSSVSNLPSTANEGDGYLVGEELYVRVNNAWKDCGSLQGPKGDQGVQGIQGNTGTGISSTTIQYQISSSATTAPTGAWSNNIVATTTTNPYLWMKATLNYSDNTTKVFYLVSQKGDKGDTGATGPTGPIGPQGPVGSGLVVKGTVKDASQLPKSGNQEGYCYFIGTDLYVWDAGAWKNCGNVSPDLSNYVTVTDLNNGLSTKVTDNKDGTEQLNGVKVQPYNKLSDVTNLRNIVLQTDNVIPYTAKGGVGEAIQDFPIYSGFSALPSGTQVYYSYDLVVTNADGGVHWLGWSSPWATFVTNQHLTTDGIHHLQGITTIPDANITSGQYIHSTIDNSHATYQITNLMIVVGSIPVTHLPAPEDKQDKIGYTPADDSKVVHDNHDGTEQLNGVQIQPYNKLSDTIGGRNLLIGTATPVSITGNNSGNQVEDTYTLVGGMSAYALYQKYGSTFTLSYDWSVTDTASAYTGLMQQQFSGNPWGFGDATTISSSNTSGHRVYTLTLANDSGNTANGLEFKLDNVPTTSTITASNMKLERGSIATDWTPAPEDKADDSKVAHLSGAEEIAGQKTFDIAPIDKTTGNPYITKDGVPAVPSTLADTTKDANFTRKLQKSGIDVATTTDVKNAVNTATSNVVTTNKPANFTAGLQSGGVSVATSDDLKSVEKAAWRQLDRSHITIDSSGVINYGDCLYRIDSVTKRIYIHWIINCMTITDNSDNSTYAHLDFSSVVSRFTSQGNGSMEYQDGSYRFSISGSEISFQVLSNAPIFASCPLEKCWFGYDTLLI